MTGDPGPLAKCKTSATNFGLLKALRIPISVKIRSVLTAHGAPLVANSDKYRSAAVFQKTSQISKNSDLYVDVQVFDGNHNPLTPAFRTPYRSFRGNKRIWDTHLRLAIGYNQVGYDAYLRFTVGEIVDTRACFFGEGCLSVFNHTDSSVRRGCYKIAIGARARVDYGELHTTGELEARLFQYENGELARSAWLDPVALPAVEARVQAEQAGARQEISPKDPSQQGDSQQDGSQQEPPLEASPLHFLVLELPNFLIPVVYADVTYLLPSIEPSQAFIDEVASDAGASTPLILNSIEIPTSRDLKTPKVYDPDFRTMAIVNFNSTREDPLATGAAQLAVSALDPIELKFQKLATNINNTLLLDKEVKPSPQVRDELWKILSRPLSAVLTDHEKLYLWKYRYYFSKNSLRDDLLATRQFFTKFFKCFNWENEYELDHAFTEILPFWSVEQIDIGDALELLSNNFNPQTITASLRRRLIATTHANAKDINNAEEKKIEKIFRYTKKLRMFAVDRLRLANADELLLYLLQLVQALKYEPVFSLGDLLKEAPLANFLIDRSVQNGVLGNFFYWYVKVENEDLLNKELNKANGISASQNGHQGTTYNIVLNTYIDRLKKHAQETRLPNYEYLKSQIAFVKKLTALVELLRSSFKRNEATGKKIQFLREYLADSSNGMLKFPEPFPLPLDPSVMICGCYPAECSVFKSSMAPLKITLKTITNHQAGGSTSSSIFGVRKKHGKYSLMFKIGDDLRQDQLVIQIINLMDQLLKNENLNLKLTPYKILATSPIAGLIQFVPNETLDSVLSNTHAENPAEANKSGILAYLQRHSRQVESEEPEQDSILGIKKNPIVTNKQQHTIVTDLGVSSQVMDNYVKSCAGYCVITYILGVGDRHLDNLLLSPNGKFWHADFGYILGRDPKPFPPLMKLPIQVIDGMGGMNHENFDIFKSYCFITYTTLRRNSNLILNLFQLMLNANIPDIQIDPKRAVDKVQEKFALSMTEEEAILHFQNLISDSVNAFLPVVIDTLHSLAQYWRA